MVSQFSPRVLLLIFLAWNSVVTCIGQMDPASLTLPPALIVTPYLDKGDSETARALAKVDIDNLTSYSGYITVDKDCGTNLFFWFIQAEVDPSNAAVLLWLQGGPGSSSAFALFQENGPWTYTKTNGLKKRDFAWTKKHNVLYIDQPGAGYSFSDKNCISDNLIVTTNMVTKAISQFFIMFPTYKNNKFFLTGESYAGHFIPQIAVQIDSINKENKIINLVGIIIVSPFLDFKCTNPLKLAYQLGIIDMHDVSVGLQHFDSFVKAVNEKDFAKAEEESQQVYGVILGGALASLYNVLYDTEIVNEHSRYLNNDNTKKRLHVGSHNFTQLNMAVYDSLWPNDAFVSIAPSLEYLLTTNKYIVGFIGGQLDLVCPYTSLTCTLEGLNWPGASQYLAITRKPWYVSNKLVGWVKTTGNLFEVAVKNAGHYVPRDQAEAALVLITAAVADSPGSPLLSGLDYGTPPAITGSKIF